MKRGEWQLHEAKSHLSEVVDSALEEGVQVITRHGQPAVVMLSVEDYERLQKPRERLIDVLRDCPVKDFQVEALRDV